MVGRFSVDIFYVPNGEPAETTLRGTLAVSPGTSSLSAELHLLKFADNACGCREPCPGLPAWTLAQDYGEHPMATLSFLYRAFCRVLQLSRLLWRSNVDSPSRWSCSDTKWPCCAARSIDRRWSRRIGRCWRGSRDLFPRHRLASLFVHPDTLLRWHLDLVTKRWS